MCTSRYLKRLCSECTLLGRCTSEDQKLHHWPENAPIKPSFPSELVRPWVKVTGLLQISGCAPTWRRSARNHRPSKGYSTNFVMNLSFAHYKVPNLIWGSIIELKSDGVVSLFRTWWWSWRAFDERRELQDPEEKVWKVLRDNENVRYWAICFDHRAVHKSDLQRHWFVLYRNLEQRSSVSL